MADPVESTSVQFSDDSGEERITVQILVKSSSDETSGPPPLLRLTEMEAQEAAEETIQLLEDCAYEYQVQEEGLKLRDGLGGTSIVSPRSTPGRSGEGDLEPGRHVGMLPLRLIDEQGEVVARAAVEVRSRKLGYRDDYRRMLDDIVEECSGLVNQVRRPSQSRLETDFSGTTPRQLGQRFAFLRSVIDDHVFNEACARVVARPHEESRRVRKKQDPRRGLRPGKNTDREMASGNPRVPLPDSHPLSGTLSSVPREVSQESVETTVDTAENRFVKHVLESFRRELQHMLEALLESRSPGDWRPSDRRLAGEINRLKENISRTLNRGLFREVSALKSLPTSSTVLQRQAGYREILQSWLRFNAAVRITSWDGGDEVFGGGQRDVSALYEYWLFFQLLEVVADLFNLERTGFAELFEVTEDRFDLKLKAGENLNFTGVTGKPNEDNLRRLKVRFSYNRTFSKLSNGPEEASYPEAGSWTRSLRPDYTLSIWPAGSGEEDIDEEEAGKKELATHLHFDAKYKVKNLGELVGDDSAEGITKEKAARRAGKRVRSADLKRAHAYRDAIRRSTGVYILFPGQEKQQWRQYQEIVPGLGAFPMTPQEEDAGSDLREFLKQVKRNLQDRASNREIGRYYITRVHSAEAERSAMSRLPELDSSRNREPPPTERVVAYDLNAGKYAIRWLQEDGAFPFSPSSNLIQLAQAEFLGVARSGESPSQLYKVESVNLISGAKLEDIGYEGDAKDEDALFLFRVAPDDRYGRVSIWNWEDKHDSRGTTELARLVSV